MTKTNATDRKRGWLFGINLLLLLTLQLQVGAAPPSTERIPWTTSRVVGFPAPRPPYRAVRTYDGMEFQNLLAFGSFPDEKHVWTVTHEGGYAGPGRIHKFFDDQAAATPELFLERPEIIYGLAFHPDFKRNGWLFIGCNGRSEKLEKKATRVLRLDVNPATLQCDPDSAVVIIEWPSNGHNGGDLAFGNDGFLYVSAGDGTSDSDPKENGQNLSTIPGSMIRIDVDEPSKNRLYRVPEDNPFLDTSGARPEIWAYGLRNPWRITFDKRSNQLWAGNNGQDAWETAHLIRRGENYGWSVLEGKHPFQAKRKPGPTPIVDPTLEHPHSEARSLTGGIVYWGERFPELSGYYVYGDYSTGNIWAAKHDGKRVIDQKHVARTMIQITGFGLNTAGEVVIVDHVGRLYRLESQKDEEENSAFPNKLSETGLFAAVKDHEMAQGVVPYKVNAPFWSDGASKQRFIAVPGTKQIDGSSGKPWEYPEGTVLVKSFGFPIVVDGTVKNRTIETRLLHLQGGQWHGYSFEWNAEGTDALLVELGGKDRELEIQLDGSVIRQRWRFPSRSECMVCHTRAANFVLGFTKRQLDLDLADGLNQIQWFAKIGLFHQSATAPPVENRLVDPYNSAADLDLRVRSYLHSNCSICHTKSGGGNSRMVLEFGKPLESTFVWDTQPQHDTFGISDARIVAPGHPARSLLLQRLKRRGQGQMPPLSSHVVDQQAVAMIESWIQTHESPP